MEIKIIISSFWQWKQSLQSTERGNKIMYDVSGWHKYLSEDKLFDYYINRVYNKK